MKFGNILKTIGKTLVSSNPVASGILSAVNMFLPEGSKLLEGSTGEEVTKAVETLSSKDKASLMEKEVDLEIQLDKGWTQRYESMCKSDGQSTRPQIALMMSKLVCFETLCFVVILAYAVVSDGLKALDSPYIWQTFLALTSIPAGLLAKYFGELRKEQTNRLNNKKIEEDENDLISKMLNVFK